MYNIEVYITNKGQVSLWFPSFLSPLEKREETFFAQRVEAFLERVCRKLKISFSFFLFPPHHHHLKKKQHNIMSLDVVVPKREVVNESWGAAHDQGEDSGRRIFSLPDFIKEKGGITAGECYNFGGVFSEADPGFLVENFDAPS